MEEVEAIKKILESQQDDEKTQSIIAQVSEFEQYLADMNITVEKRQILLHREDVLPQSVCFNY